MKIKLKYIKFWLFNKFNSSSLFLLLLILVSGEFISLFKVLFSFLVSFKLFIILLQRIKFIKKPKFNIFE